jgi:bifunctional DNA-binding transcriptional regulator/antitoxin component of YhaV-PrlF toxin-antitoxin module
MLAKMTSKNQITIPEKIVEQILDTKYFEVEVKDGLIVLKPLRLYATDLEKIRSKVKRLGLKPDSVREAVKWARSK